MSDKAKLLLRLVSAVIVIVAIGFIFMPLRTLNHSVPDASAAKARQDYTIQAEEYREYIRLVAKDPGAWLVEGGTLKPVFVATVVNTGSRSVDYLKVVGELKGGAVYHDVVVVMPLRTSDSALTLTPDGGRCEFKVRFAEKALGESQKQALLLSRAEWKFKITEVGFVQ